jgi:hypothetical protein
LFWYSSQIEFAEELQLLEVPESQIFVLEDQIAPFS